MKLSLIIPAYNEENRIPETLKNYLEFLKEKLKKSFEIIVVPNNCRDKTLEIVQEFALKNKVIKILNIPYYVGKGGAVIKGFEIAKGDYIGFVDADHSTSPENFFKLYENKRDFDGLIASRRIKGAIIKPKRELNKELSSILFNKITNILFSFKYKDTQCGAKLFTKKTTQFLVKNSTETGWVFDVDLLWLCKKKNLKILEYPIIWTDTEDSRLNFQDKIRSILRLFRYRFKTH